MNYWGFDMEAGLNCALKTGCSTSNIHRHMKNTHTHTNAGRLVWGRVNGVTQTDRQGDWATQESALPRFPHWNTPSPEERTPRDQTDMLLFLRKTHTTPRVSPSFSHPLFPPKSKGGFQGQEITMPSVFPTVKDCFPQSVKVYFCVSWFSFEPQTVPLCSDLSGWKQSSGWALSLQWCSRLCGPVTQGLCLLGRSIVNLLLDTLSCRSVQLDNRPLAVSCSAAVCGDLWWIEA